MAEPKHSLSPWRVEDRFWDGERVVVDANDKCVAGPVNVREYESCTIVDGIREDDACLIAAAPDLLAACEALLRDAREFFPTVSGEAITTAEAAIKKARGEP